MPEVDTKKSSARLAILLTRTLETATRIQTAEQLLFWAEHQLRPLAPHALLICGQLEFGDTAWGIRQVIRHHYGRDNKALAIPVEESRLLLSLARSWAQTGKPQLMLRSPGTAARQQALPAPLVLLGVHDASGQGASFVALCGLAPEITGTHLKMIEMIVPQMHAVLGSLICRQRHAQPKLAQAAPPDAIEETRRVSPREREVLRWLQEGKTNLEIAQILDISDKTVKNHVQKILVKLRVNNRAQAVAMTLTGRLTPAEVSA